MQIHFGKPCFDSYGPPHLNATRPDAPFVTLPIGPLELTILDEAEADKLITTAWLIKDMFRQHALMPQPIWAVVDGLEGEVAGPMTHADAAAYIRDNDSFFVGALTIEPAKPELDVPRAEQVVPGGYTLPAADVPAGTDAR